MQLVSVPAVVNATSSPRSRGLAVARHRVVAGDVGGVPASIHPMTSAIAAPGCGARRGRGGLRRGRSTASSRWRELVEVPVVGAGPVGSAAPTAAARTARHQRRYGDQQGDSHNGQASGRNWTARQARRARGSSLTSGHARTHRPRDHRQRDHRGLHPRRREPVAVDPVRPPAGGPVAAARPAAGGAVARRAVLPRVRLLRPAAAHVHAARRRQVPADERGLSDAQRGRAGERRQTARCR